MPIGELIGELTPTPIKETVDGATGRLLAFSDTVAITIPANAFTTGGLALTTPVVVDTRLIYKRGQLIRSGRTTAENNHIIIPLAVMELNVWSNTTAASLLSNHSLLIRLTTDTVNLKKYVLLSGKNNIANDDASFSWTRQNINIASWSSIGSGSSNKTGLQFNSNNLGWSAIGKYIDSTLPVSRLNVSLPLNYTNKNTAVFAAFKNNNAVIRLQADAVTKSFSHNRIPLNSELILVSITKIGTDYYLGTKEIKLKNADLQNIIPVKSNLNAIKEFLNKL